MSDAESLLRSWAREIVYKYPERIKSAKSEALRNRNLGVGFYILASGLWLLDGGETFISWLAIMPFLAGTIFLVTMESSNQYTKSLEERYLKMMWFIGQEYYASVISWSGEENFERRQELSNAGIDLFKRFKAEEAIWSSAYVPV